MLCPNPVTQRTDPFAPTGDYSRTIPNLLLCLQLYKEEIDLYYPYPHDPATAYVRVGGRRVDMSLLQVITHEMFGFSLGLGLCKQCWKYVASDKEVRQTATQHESGFNGYAKQLRQLG